MKALLLENIHPDAERLLVNRGFEVTMATEALAEDALIEALQGVDYLGIRSRTQLTKRVIDAAPGLRAVGAFCIGTNQIDLDAATEAGVAVFNAPYSNTRSVVELAICEIIALARRLTDRNRDMHAGVWDKSAIGSHEVRGRTLGLVGFGHVARALARLVAGFDMKILAATRHADDAALADHGAERIDLDALCARSDIVSLHALPSTPPLFHAARLARMKPGAILINTARGALVDEAALSAALAAGRLGAAGLDVFAHEPLPPDHP
ncbi:MAG: phosphoglycerate dehydrogenase, partial [Propionibacteriaceae bacterium]|nr:phosphoglycerate dehydrogenase [Propionibacteriaceae bacterium]